MESRLQFRARFEVAKPTGTPKQSRRGHVDRPCKGVGASRDLMPRRTFGCFEFCGVCGQEKLRVELQNVRTVNRHRWARRVASGQRAKRAQGTRHNDPVTSEGAMPTGVARLARLAR